MLDHWKSKAIVMLEHHLPNANVQVRIATGFFTVQGYNLIRTLVRGITVKVMVGYDEISHERLRQKLIDDIMAYLSRWDVSNRRDAVIELVTKFQLGQFYISEQNPTEFVEARIRNRDHGKVYIIDDHTVLSGSANLTENGLLHNFENLAAVLEPWRVAEWSADFEKYWSAPDTHDLTQALMDALLKWLDLSIPYDVYLKTIQALVPEDNTSAIRNSYRQPVAFQKVVIERTLRQLKLLRGSIIVASTGLGKTVMATHVALRLYREGRISNAVIFAPLQVHKEWKLSFRDAGVYVEVYTRNLLDQPRSGRGKAVHELDDALRACDDKTLLIIDETQYFVNRLRSTGQGERNSFERIVEVVHPRSSYILLLTATPIVKAVEDLNSQLYLLPHTASSDSATVTGQMYLLPPDKGIGGHYPWTVQETENYFEEFMNLPVATVISTSYVAKTFAMHTDQGDLIKMGATDMWIPQIELRKITIPVPVEQEMTRALEGGLFKHRRRAFPHRGGWMQSETTIQREALVAWASSPWALAEVLRDTIEDTYQVEFIKTKEERHQSLQPILDKLSLMDFEQDQKFLALCKYVARSQQEGRKTIIFSERLATCIYLEAGLAELMPTLEVANAVQETRSGYELKAPEMVHELILDFAPAANSEKLAGRKVGTSYDVFISTDAYGVGVNLQDASVVISYDIAWTPDIIIQRAGRILRLWKEPRKVQLYIFIGTYEEHVEGREAATDLESRLRRLMERSRQAEQFTEIPMIPEDASAEFTSLASLTNVQMESMGTFEASDIEEFSGVSHFLQHITERSQNLEYADAIPDDVTSAMVYSGRRAQIYLLLRYQNEFHWMLYDIHSKRLRNIKEDELLDLIQCTKHTPVASVHANEIEEQAQACRRLWCAQHKIDNPDEVERVCALFLKPHPDDSGFSDMLR